MPMNVFDIVMEMEQHHVKPYRTDYPRVRSEGTEDDAFHSVLKWMRDSRPKNTSPSILYDHHVVFIDGMKYLIEDGVRKMFPNDETFYKMGYQYEMLLNRIGTVIPYGDDLPDLKTYNKDPTAS